jgi:hypothetical protein
VWDGRYGESGLFKLRFACRTNGRYPANEFLEDLKTRDLDSLDKFNRIFEKLMASGPESVEGFYKRLQGRGKGLVEFAIWNYRILAFRSGNEIFLTNGFKKDQNETPTSELDRGQEIKKEHLQQQQQQQKQKKDKKR